MESAKLCPDCGAERPISDFTRNKRQKDGLAFYCRDHARLRLRQSKLRRQGPPQSRHAVGKVVPAGSKWCPDCDTVKLLTDFPTNPRNGTGRHSYCKPCHNARGRATLEKIGGARGYHLKRRYGISSVEADDMLAGQGGLCGICRAAPAVHVDHDHVTGAVRALLCFNCNGGLGQFRDDPDVLRAAADYVEHHRQTPREGRPTADRPPRRRSPGFLRWQAMQSAAPRRRRSAVEVRELLQPATGRAQVRPPRPPVGSAHQHGRPSRTAGEVDE